MADDSYEALGFSFSVASDDPVLGSRIAEVLAPLTAEGSAEHTYLLCRSGAADAGLDHEMLLDGVRVSGACGCRGRRPDGRWSIPWSMT